MLPVITLPILLITFIYILYKILKIKHLRVLYYKTKRNRRKHEVLPEILFYLGFFNLALLMLDFEILVVWGLMDLYSTRYLELVFSILLILVILRRFAYIRRGRRFIIPQIFKLFVVFLIISVILIILLFFIFLWLKDKKYFFFMSQGSIIVEFTKITDIPSCILVVMLVGFSFYVLLNGMFYRVKELGFVDIEDLYPEGELEVPRMGKQKGLKVYGYKDYEILEEGDMPIKFHEYTVRDVEEIKDSIYKVNHRHIFSCRKAVQIDEKILKLASLYKERGGKGKKKYKKK